MGMQEGSCRYEGKKVGRVGRVGRVDCTTVSWVYLIGSS